MKSRDLQEVVRRTYEAGDTPSLEGGCPAESDERGDMKMRPSFSQRVKIEKGLPMALEYGDETFEKDWMLQGYAGRTHTPHLTHKWCLDNFLSFIDKDHWPLERPDLNH